MFHPSIYPFSYTTFIEHLLCVSTLQDARDFPVNKTDLVLLPWYLESGEILEVLIEALSLDYFSKGVEKH